MEDFSRCEEGWAHWDLFVDNILFQSESVCAILDFDRLNYVYPEFDISRSILSCCIQEGKLRLKEVSAFVEGYREYKELTHRQLIRSIKLTWWKEAGWIQPEKVTDSEPLKRFREENIWVAAQWDRLEDLFSTV